MNTRKKRILLATVVVLLLIVASAVAFVIDLHRMPTETIQDLRAFCEGLDRRTTMSEVLKRASEVREKPLKAEVFDQHKVLVQLHSCHCFITFTETGTTASKVTCNG